MSKAHRFFRSNGQFWLHLSWAFFVFSCSMYFVPYTQLHQFTHLPGDLGDSRLNNYFLENIYLFFSGSSPSLIHLGFFYPFPHTLGFSDNLFGSFPVYFLARILTGQSEIGFGLWYAVSYFVNYFSTYYVLRKLNFSNLACITGALIFAFALPVSAQTSHVQLAYRFSVPLATLGAIRFLRDQSWGSLLVSFIWVVWQFYCSIYLGFFLSLMILAIFIVFGLHLLLFNRGRKNTIRLFLMGWQRQGFRNQAIFISLLLALVLSLIALFYPYLKVTELYGTKRSLSDIANMLPRLRSYLLMEESWLWSFLGGYVSDTPMRHEHQIFFGAIPILLVLIGLIFGGMKRNGLPFLLLAGCLIFLVVLTLNFRGHSFWLHLAGLPLVSAMRAMTRISLVLLFPIAYLSAVAVDAIPMRLACLRYALIASSIFEFSTVRVNSSSIAEWREHSVASINKVPGNLPPSSVLFFSQDPAKSIANQELDAMWAALRLGFPTLNGYSGSTPPGFKQNYGKECTEISRRIQAYFEFSQPINQTDEYQKLIKRVVPIGFEECNFAINNNYRK